MLYFILGVLITWLVMSGLLSQMVTFLLRLWWPTTRKEKGILTDQWLLNSGVSTSSGWRLMGYWRETADYSQACSELAGLLADKACLSNQDCVLDVGFASYDQLLVWLDYYQVKSLRALAETEQLLAEAHDQCAHYEQLELERGSEQELEKIANGTFDKILALDCLYHFDNKVAFFENAHRLLKKGGALTVTDMVLARPYKSKTEQRTVALMARACDIPVGGLLPQRKYESVITESGFVEVEFIDISQDVLSGFCFWFSQHYRKLSYVTQSKVWIRLRLTVWFIRWMQHRGLLEYHLIHIKN